MANTRYCVDGEGKGGGNFVIGLLAGTVLGAGVALLFAPKPGKEFRRDLGEQADKLASDASDTYRRASDGATHWARKASAAAEEVTERGKELYNNARDAVAKGADEAQRYREAVNVEVPVPASDLSASADPQRDGSTTGHPDGTGPFGQGSSTGPETSWVGR